MKPAPVNQRLESLEQLNEEFLGSEEFFELFRRTAEIVAHSSSAQKRRLLADYLAGRVQGAGITDIGLQVLGGCLDATGTHPKC